MLEYGFILDSGEEGGYLGGQDEVSSGRRIFGTLEKGFESCLG